MRRATLLLLLLLLLLPGQALAHAALLSSIPADGAVLEAAPGTLALRFDEPVTPTALALAGPDGRRVALPPPMTAGPEITVAPPAGLGEGSYVLSYRIISADGHPVAGAIAYRVGGGADDPRPRAGHGPADPGRVPAIVLLALLLGLLLLGTGGALALAALPPLAGPRRAAAARLVRLAALAGLPLALAVLAVQAVRLAGDWAALATGAAWLMAWRSTLGPAMAVLALGLAAVALLTGRPQYRRELAAAGLAALLALLLTGHVVTAPPAWLAAGALAVHLAAVAFWAGALPLLLVALRDGAAALPVVAGFSRLGVAAVGLLAVSGTVIATLQVRAPEALLATDYGRALLGKLAAVVLLLGLAALNRWRLMPRLARGDAGPLRRAIAAEMALMAVVLAATAVLGNTPPPRVLAPAPPAETAFVPAAAIDGQTVRGALVRAADGRLTLRARFADAAGHPLAACEVAATLIHAEAGIGPLQRPMRAAPDGGFELPDAPLAVPGSWTVEFQVLVGEFELLTFVTEIRIDG